MKYQLRESIKAVHLSLVNDMQFVMRMGSFDMDLDSYVYLRDKIKLEIEGPCKMINVSAILGQIQQDSLSTASTKERMPFEEEKDFCIDTSASNKRRRTGLHN